MSLRNLKFTYTQARNSSLVATYPAFVEICQYVEPLIGTSVRFFQYYVCVNIHTHVYILFSKEVLDLFIYLSLRFFSLEPTH